MKKLRLLKASPFYDGYLRQFHARRPDLAKTSYQHQLKSLLQDGFAWADFWQTTLEATGEFEVEEIVSNAEALQKAWAREHDTAFTTGNWKTEILVAQIRKFQPDIFFAHDYWHIHAEVRQALKREFPHLKIIAYDGVALNDANRFEGCDCMLSTVDFILDVYRRAGMKTYLLPAGFEPSLLGRIHPGREKHAVTFVGGLSLGPRGHRGRMHLLRSLTRRLPLELWLDMPSPAAWLRSRAGLIARGRFGGAVRGFGDELSGVLALARRNHGAAFGIEMYQTLADSKITLNSHIDASGSKGGNMRLFEATGVGTCLVTDWKENLSDFFEPDREVVTYRSAEECAEKVHYLLSHDAERRAIAQAGQKRTLRDHNLGGRILGFGRFLKEWLGEETRMQGPFGRYPRSVAV
jgi:spore maturation protein CgeB